MKNFSGLLHHNNEHDYYYFFFTRTNKLPRLSGDCIGWYHRKSPDVIAVGIGGSFLGPNFPIQRPLKQQGGGNCIFLYINELRAGKMLMDLPDWNNAIVCVHEFISVA
ncbi:unnamed protein product [Prunus armeniaca]